VVVVVVVVVFDGLHLIHSKEGYTIIMTPATSPPTTPTRPPNLKLSPSQRAKHVVKEAAHGGFEAWFATIPPSELFIIYRGGLIFKEIYLPQWD